MTSTIMQEVYSKIKGVVCMMNHMVKLSSWQFIWYNWCVAITAGVLWFYAGSLGFAHSIVATEPGYEPEFHEITDKFQTPHTKSDAGEIFRKTKYEDCLTGKSVQVQWQADGSTIIELPSRRPIILVGLKQ